MGAKNVYASVKSYSKRGKLLKKADFQTLSESRDLEELMTRIKNTIYGDSVSDVQKPYTSQKIENALRGHLADVHYSIAKTSGDKSIFNAYYMKFIISNLKSVLKGKVLGKSQEEIEADDALGKFDEFIRQFNETEFMRYPKGRENLKAGQKDANEIDISLSFDESITNIEPNAINWSINTVDELIYVICKRMRSPISTIDWIEKRYRKNDVFFNGNKYFKKSTSDDALTIRLSAPPRLDKK